MADLGSFDVDRRGKGVKTIMTQREWGYLGGVEAWAQVFETIYMMYLCEPYLSLRGSSVHNVVLEMKKRLVKDRPVWPDEARIRVMALARNKSWAVALTDDLGEKGVPTFKVIIGLSSIKSEAWNSELMHSTLQDLRISMLPLLLRGMALYPEQITPVMRSEVIHAHDLATNPALVIAVLGFRQGSPPATNDPETTMLLKSFEACRVSGENASHLIGAAFPAFQTHPRILEPGRVLKHRVTHFNTQINRLGFTCVSSN